MTLGQGHYATQAGCNLPCPHDELRTTHPMATKLGRYTPPPYHAFQLIQFGRNAARMLFSDFLTLNSKSVFSSRTFYGHIGPIDVKQKEMSQLDAMLTRVPLTLTFDLEFSRSDCISGMGGPIVMERMGRQSIGCPDVKH